MKEKRSITKFIVFAIMAAAIFSKMVQAQETPERPNVVFITADDLSANRLGPYGKTVVKTPLLDAFAKASLTFNRAYCQVPQCGQSRNSIFTGVRPETSGLWKLKDKWREALPDAVSMQRHFINNGYAIDEIGKLFDPRSGSKDYKNDPRGLVNIANEHHEIVDKLTKRLNAGPDLNWQPSLPGNPN